MILFAACYLVVIDAPVLVDLLLFFSDEPAEQR